MNAYALLFAEFLISIAVSLAVLHILSGPLVNLLDRLCPDEQAAQFWQSHVKVMLIIAPLLLVLTVGILAHFSDPLDSLRLALMAALGGLLLGLHSLGKRLARFEVPAQPRDTSCTSC